MSSLFISHSSQDAKAANRLKARLEKEDYRSVFLSCHRVDGILGGQPWEQVLYSEVKSCRGLVILCSKHSMNSRWCFAELIYAKALGKTIVPLEIDKGDETWGLWRELVPLQAIDFTTESEGAYASLRRALEAADLVDWNPDRSPFPGLDSFREEYAGVFYGRKAEVVGVQEKVEQIRLSQNPRLAIVVGASGCGKSSLVRAGVVPRLKRDTRRWVVVPPFAPGGQPLEHLAGAFAVAFGTGHTDWKDILGRLNQDDASDADEPRDSHLARLATDLRIAKGDHESAVLLVVDQFEELLGSTPAPAAMAFLRVLRRGLAVGGGKVLALATLRSDFLGTFQGHPVMRDVPFEGIPLGPLPQERFAEIITGPAERAGIWIEPGLVDTMIRDTQTDHALPLLAYTLYKMYLLVHDPRCPNRPIRFTQKLYADDPIGGIRGVVERTANEIARGMTQEAEAVIRQSFLSMVEPKEEGDFVRRTVRWDNLPAPAHEILRAFVASRLLTLHKGHDGQETVEVVHESLFKVWPKLNSWLEENREFMLWRNRILRPQMEDWLRHEQSRGYLLTDAQLSEAKKWRDEHHDFDELQSRFIQASLDREHIVLIDQLEQQKRLERVRRALAGDAEAVKTHLTAGQYEEAKKRLDEAIRDVERETDPDLVAHRNSLLEQQARLGRLVAFFQFAGLVYTKAGEEEYDEALAACEESLNVAGVKAMLSELENPGGVEEGVAWRDHMPAEDLSDAQLDFLKREIYRQLILLSGLRTKPGLVKLSQAAGRPRGGALAARLGKFSIKLARRLLPASAMFVLVKKRFGESRDAVAHFESALVAVRWVEAFEKVLVIGQEDGFRPSIISRIILRVNQFGKAIADPSSGTTFESLVVQANPDTSASGAVPTNPADFYFVGLMHFFIGKFQASILTTMIASFQRLFPELDRRTPLDTAERLLRAGISRESDNFWPHFVLGRTFLSRGEAMRRSWFKRIMNFVLGRADIERGHYVSAELAFNSCISLQPDYARGYEQRAVAVGLQWRHTKGRGPLKDQLHKRAVDDSKMAEEKARGDPSTYWPQADLLVEFEEAGKALDAYARALELEENLLEKMSRGNRVEIVFEFARSQVNGHRNRVKESDRAILAEAYGVMALIHRIQGELDAAARSAERALEIRHDHAHALTALGSVRLDQGKPDLAIKAFERVLGQDPSNYLAALKLMDAYASLSNHSKVLQSCDHLLHEAAGRQPAPAWMRRKASEARGVALGAIGRSE